MADEVLDDEVVIGEVVESAPPLPDIDLPDDPTAAVGVLLEALAEARAGEADRLDDLQRLAAEFENYRKRAARDQQEIVERASQRLVMALLPVLDSFDGAFAHEAHSPSEELLLSGVKGTFHQLMEILQAEGLAVIHAAGEPFDPTLHEAVTGATGHDLVVSDELRRGYTLRDRIVRPALVAVAAAEGTEET